MAHHLLDRAEAQARHDLAQLLGCVQHEVHHVLRLAREALPQARVLRGDTHGAGVLLAVALHEAAKRDERRRAEAKLLGTQEARDRDVAAVHELRVGLDHHAGAQAVQKQRLLRLGKAKLQGKSRMVDGVARRRSRAAVRAGDQDLVRTALRDASRDRANSGLAHELDGDHRVRVRVLQVEDELRQVLDGVDVVVGRGRDQADAGRGVPDLRDPRPDLLAGEVSPLAGLRALGHLDLDLLCAPQVAARHAKARGRDLLDRGVRGVAVRQRRLADGVLAALARVGLAAQAVHRDGERLVRLLADGAVGHGRAREALHDLARRLDLVDRHGTGRQGHEGEKVGEHDGAAGPVQRGAVLLEQVVAALADGALQQVDDLGGQHVLLAAQRAPLRDAGTCQLVGRRALALRLALVVAALALALDVVHGKAAHRARSAVEAVPHDLRGKADDLEDLRGVVALHRRDAHLGHNGHDAGGECLVVVLDARLRVDLDAAVRGHLADELVREVRVDRGRAVAHEARVVVRRHGVAGLDHDVAAHAQAAPDEVAVHGAEREERRHGHLPVRDAIGEHDDVHALAHRGLNLVVQAVERLGERVLSPVAVERRDEAAATEAHHVNVQDAVELVLSEDGGLQPDEAAAAALVLEQVSVVAEVQDGRRDEVLAKRVDGRVRDLGKQLVEVVKERAGAPGQHGERHVRAHGGAGALARDGHGANGLLDVVEVVSVARQADRQRRLRVSGLALLVALGRGREVVHAQRLLRNPVAIGLLARKRILKLVVPHDATLVGVDEEHLAGAERACLDDVLRLDVARAGLGREDEAVVARDVVARGAQAVAVERRAHVVAVGVRDGGGAVPRLGQHGLVCAERTTLLGELGVLVPRLGQQHRDRTRQRAAVHHEELEHVVEHRGVGALAPDDGHDLLQLRAHHGRVQLRLACADAVHVAAQRVDLAVVDDVAVGVRALPARRRVRGVARVHERDGRLGPGVAEVAIERAQLRRHEHALVHDGVGAHGAHVERLARKRALLLGHLLDNAARHVQLALEVLAGGSRLGPAQERLHDVRTAAVCRVAQVVRVDGHLAPEQQGHALLRAAVLEHAARVAVALRVLREEQHGDAVVALCGQDVPLALRLPAEQAMRDLEQHAGAVARVLLQALAAAVLQVHEHRERVVQHRVRALAAKARQRADAACVVLVLRSVQPLGLVSLPVAARPRHLGGLLGIMA